MTKTGPWSEIKISRALEKEHKAELKEKREKQKLSDKQKSLYYDFYHHLENPNHTPAGFDAQKELKEKGYTVVNNKDELISVLKSVLGEDLTEFDITYEDDDDKKDLS